MTATKGTYVQWLSEAQIAEERLTPELRRRLLLQPLAQPFPAPLRRAAQGRADRSLGRRQPAYGFASARHLFQGGDSGGAPPQGRPAPRQAVAALRRLHRRVHSDPCRRHALRPPRLHRAHLGRARVHGGLASLLQEVWPRPCHDRWHPLFTTSAGFPEDVLPIFRTRQ